ncbi:MAG: nucleotidyltransferase family protein [Sphaerochaeta sp.]|jgi:molybdenum cofactor cytidylyltransferase|nr:nucleotidyltransferase family protein [Sphaerochaeta sp.]
MQNIMLAAGLGSRSGGEKLFYPWNGKDIIHHSVEASLQAGLYTIVVTGFQKARVDASLRDLACPSLLLVPNDHYRDGQFSSTQVGAGYLHPDEDFFVTLGDLPLIEPNHYLQLARAMDGYNGVRPFFQQKRPGHPVLLRPLFIPLIQSADKTETMHHLLSRPDIMAYATDDPAYVTDIDTAQAYEEILTKSPVFPR